MAQRLSNLLAVVCVCLAVPAHAETLHLLSGQKVEGKILKEDKSSILLDAGLGTPVTYFRDEIKSISNDPVEVIPASSAAGPQADQIEAKGLALIDEDKMEEGLKLIRQAIALDPTPQRHMNYGSILFGNGVSLFKKGETGEGTAVLKEAEQYLQKAIRSFDKSSQAPFLSQSYFLIGEMYRNAFNDPAKAKENYIQALKYFDHASAKTALAALK